MRGWHQHCVCHIARPLFGGHRAALSCRSELTQKLNGPLRHQNCNEDCPATHTPPRSGATDPCSGRRSVCECPANTSAGPSRVPARAQVLLRLGRHSIGLVIEL